MTKGVKLLLIAETNKCQTLCAEIPLGVGGWAFGHAGGSWVGLEAWVLQGTILVTVTRGGQWLST